MSDILARADQRELWAIRRELRALHQPFEGRCVECVEYCDCRDKDICTHGNVPWPCRTAIAARITI